jgi:predicted DNA binding protein
VVSENNPIRVFVTHVFEESDDYLRVFEFLESVDRFYYINVSKPENIPSEGGVDAIKTELIQQIKTAEAVVVIADVYETKSDLVSYMMDVAEANNIKMIAIRPFGGITETAPGIVERVNEHLEWNAREIVDAISRQGRGEDTARWEVIDFPGFDADGEIK